MKIDPFRLERFFAKHEFSAPLLMCASDCETMELGELLSLGGPGESERFSSLRLGYTDSLGCLELREAIASLYDQVSPDQVLVHTGAEEAIFNFMNAALEPGDHVIVHAPCYQSLAEVARAIGARVTEWRGDPENRWEPDLEMLRSLLGRSTRAVVVNFPHNPTGFLPSTEFLRELSRLSERHGFRVFSDEVYRGLELDPESRLPAFADLNENAVSLGVMSKTFGLAGLRIGWVATRESEIFGRLAAFKDYTTICNSAPGEFLAALALRHADRIVERNLGIIRKNLGILDDFFLDNGDLFRWDRPAAGSVAFPLLKRGTADGFCGDLLERKGVLLAPGSLFGTGENAFRVGFGRKDLPEALGRLAEYVREERRR